MTFILIVLGSLSWIITMFKSGLMYDFGIGYWGANGHDGIWHIALINQLVKGKFVMPTFSGAVLQNYHIGFDLLLAFINKITTIPISVLYFQVLPVIFSLLMGILTYKFVISWKKSTKAALWSTFFVYFGGSFGWVITLLRSGQLGGESMFWSQQAITTLINPPFALSLIFILLGLISLLRFQKTNSIRDLLLTSILFGLLIQIKVYAGLLMLGGLFLSGIWRLRQNKDYNVLKVFFLSLLLSLVIFLPFNQSAAGMIIFKPFWLLESMMQVDDRVGWKKYGFAMVNYKLAGNWIKMLISYFIAFLIFWYGNFSTRVIAEIGIAKTLINKKVSALEIMMFSIILAGVFIPMFFVQKGTAWNTIQFFYYSLFFLSILAGVYLSELLASIKRSTRIKHIMAVGVILFTIPTTIGSLFFIYLPKIAPAKLSVGENEALNFLSNQPDGVVLTYPLNRESVEYKAARAPRPLRLYESTAYVSAYSGKVTFLEDEVNLNITGYDWPNRKETVLSFLNTLEEDKARSFLRENNISYIYWFSGQRARLGEKQLGIEKIYENNEVNIYSVNP